MKAALMPRMVALALMACCAWTVQAQALDAGPDAGAGELGQVAASGTPSVEEQSGATLPGAALGSSVDVVRVLISADQETTLVAPMSGRISEFAMKLGGAFEKDAVLLAFDCGENQARARIAQAELRAARENHGAKSRLRALKAAGDVEVNLAAAAVEKGVGQVELAQVQTAQCTVKAPFDGRVARIHAKQYQGVNVGAPLVDIISDGPLKVRLNAPSRWLGKLAVGMPFEVAVDETGRRYPAKVSAVGARVDAAAQSIEIEGQFDEVFPELLAGMSGTVRFDAIE